MIVAARTSTRDRVGFVLREFGVGGALGDPIEVAALVASFFPTEHVSPRRAVDPPKGAAGTGFSSSSNARTLEAMRSPCPHLGRAVDAGRSAPDGDREEPRPGPAMTRVIRSDDAFAGCSAFAERRQRARRRGTWRLPSSRIGFGIAGARVLARGSAERAGRVIAEQSVRRRGHARRVPDAIRATTRMARRERMRFSGTRGDPRGVSFVFSATDSPTRPSTKITAARWTWFSGLTPGPRAFVAAARNASVREAHLRRHVAERRMSSSRSTFSSHIDATSRAAIRRRRRFVETSSTSSAPENHHGTIVFESRRFRVES